jgi:hypothetical protein
VIPLTIRVSLCLGEVRVRGWRAGAIRGRVRRTTDVMLGCRGVLLVNKQYVVDEEYG